MPGGDQSREPLTGPPKGKRNLSRQGGELKKVVKGWGWIAKRREGGAGEVVLPGKRKLAWKGGEIALNRSRFYYYSPQKRNWHRLIRTERQRVRGTDPGGSLRGIQKPVLHKAKRKRRLHRRPFHVRTAVVNKLKLQFEKGKKGDAKE